MSFRHTIIALAVALTPAVPAAADIFVPDDLPSIRTAIDVVLPGETIFVGPGTYPEPLDFEGKAISIVSLEGPDVTILGGVSVPDAIVQFRNGEGPDSVLDGFTISGGSGDNDTFVQSIGGGMVVAVNSSPAVRNCIIRDNQADFGGGVFVQNSAPTFVNCIFASNVANLDGGAVHEQGSSTTFVNCVFTLNDALGQVGQFGDGGALMTLASSSPTLVNCTFDANDATNEGSAIHDAAGAALIVNSIIWGNSPPFMFGSPTILSSNVEGGYPGDGNIDADPQFFDPTWRHLRLRRTSPCIDAGASGTSEVLDIEGLDRILDGNGDGVATVDMGAFEFNPRVLNTSSELRFGSLQEAIDDAADGDEVVADPGRYHETIDLAGRTIALRSAAGADSTTIDGAGLQATIAWMGDTSGRDLVLDGFTITRGAGFNTGAMAIGGASPTITDCVFVDNVGPVAGGILIEGGEPLITGCTFRDNLATGFGLTGGAIVFVELGAGTITDCTFEGNTAVRGGAVSLDSGSPSFSGCTFRDNVAPDVGGGLYIRNSEPTFTACLFEGNQSGDSGGAALCVNNPGDPPGHTEFIDCTFTGNTSAAGAAIYNDSMDTLISSCTFTMNSASSGGAVYNWRSDAQLVSCDFVENEADDFGGAVLNGENDAIITGCTFTANAGEDGGAICNLSQARATILDCAFTANSATDFGGWGGAILNQDDGGALVRGCAFVGNSAAQGGAMLSAGELSRPVVTSCTFTGNTAGFGGAVYHHLTGHATYKSCEFSGNEAMNAGGAASSHDVSAADFVNCVLAGNHAPRGGALDCSESVVRSINCTFYGNSADDASDQVHSQGGSDVTIVSSILWSHQDAIAGDADVRHSTIEGGHVGPGNIDADPLFVDATAGDFHLERGSPCIDAGDGRDVPADTCDLDLDGNVIEPVPLDVGGADRFVDDPGTIDTGVETFGGLPVVDIGAFEYAPCPGDFDGDGHIGFDELAILLGNWGLCAGCPQDLDDDGTVGFNDLSILLGHWGDDCPEQ